MHRHACGRNDRHTEQRAVPTGDGGTRAEERREREGADRGEGVVSGVEGLEVARTTASGKRARREVEGALDEAEHGERDLRKHDDEHQESYARVRWCRGAIDPRRPRHEPLE